MRAKLVALPEFEDARLDSDCAWLIQQVKNIHYNFETKKDMSLSLADAGMSLYTEFQKPGMSITKFYDAFCHKVDTIVNQGGDTGAPPAIVQQLLQKAGHSGIAQIVKDNTLYKLTHI